METSPSCDEHVFVYVGLCVCVLVCLVIICTYILSTRHTNTSH